MASSRSDKKQWCKAYRKGNKEEYKIRDAERRQTAHLSEKLLKSKVHEFKKKKPTVKD